MLLGLGLQVLVFFQPWARCAEDDSSAGCPLEGVSVAMTLSSGVSFAIGIVLVALVAYLTMRRRAPRD
jgi:hypothetical protein